jgi:NAD(P)-dependent dehydrogenase (short-subunit alcohol dehydrogenase family)
MRLSGKVAIVTGGARGIGAAIAMCLAEDGAEIAILDLDGEEAARTAASLGVPAIGLATDASDAAAVEAAVATVAESFGGIDIFVNNAGGGTPDDLKQVPGFEHLPQANWDAMLATNLRTTYAGSRAAIPHLRHRSAGSIVNISSIAGQLPTPQLAAYGAAKAGVIHLTKTLALELAPSQIRVNAICPGYLWTRAWEQLATAIRDADPNLSELTPRDIFLKIVERGVPLGSEQTPEDIGKLATFLASDDARSITGQAIAVDGGITLNMNLV